MKKVTNERGYEMDIPETLEELLEQMENDGDDYVTNYAKKLKAILEDQYEGPIH